MIVTENIKDSVCKNDSRAVDKKNCEENSVSEPLEPSCLADYYSDEGYSVRQFLKSLKKCGVTSFQKEDIDKTLSMLDDLDPNFSKSLDLLFKAKGKKTVLFKEIVNFVRRACKQQLEVHYTITDLDRLPAGNRLSAVVTKLLNELPLKTDKGKQSFNLVKALAIGLSESRELDDNEITKILVDSLTKQNVTNTKAAIPRVLDILLKPTANFKSTTNVLHVANTGFTQARLATDERNRESQKKLHVEQKLEDVQTELSNNYKTTKNLEEIIDTLAGENKLLTKQIEDNQAVSNHAASELKGRSKVLLEHKITDLLKQALEFSELDPPRTNVTIERIEMALTEIRRELSWLRSMD